MAKKKRRRRITEAARTAESILIWQEAAIARPQGDDPTGNEWEVTIIGARTPADLVTIEGQEYVRSKNGRLYSVPALEASVPQWEGVKVYDNHLTEEEFKRRQGLRSAGAEWLGSIVAPFWDAAGRKVKGVFKVVESTLVAKLKAAWEQGVLDTIGLSIDVYPQITREASFEGKRLPIIEGFNKILSVDLVAEPAAGGSFDRIMAATQNNEVLEMEREELQELIGSAVSDALGTAVPDLVRQTLAEADATAEADTPDEAEAAEADTPDEAEAAEATTEAVRLVEARVIMNEAIARSGLGQKTADLVRRQFGGKLFKEDDLSKFIKTLKETEAGADPSGRVTENGRAPITGGFDEKQRFEVEFMRLAMGNRIFGEIEHNQESFVRERVSESQAYRDWLRQGKPHTGGYRRLSNLVTDLLGGDPFMDEIRFAEASTLASVTKNAVNVMIANDYSKQQRWYESIVNTEEVDTIDTATLVKVYGVSTLDVVNKGAAYTELSQADDEETPTFVKRGNYIGVPLEDLMLDKLNYFRSIPRRLSNAWYNTLSSLVAGVFTVNSATGPVLAADSGALFNATAATSAGGHANLLTAALSHANFSAARTAMMKQTDQALGVGEKLLITPRYLLVPVDLETTANQIRNSEQIPASANNDVNPFFQQFEVVVVPGWTDTDDWALVGDPAMHPAIWLIFPRGGQTPQLFTADAETAGAMFTNDTLRFKVRMMTYRFSATYDCAPVSDFRALHKNNV